MIWRQNLLILLCFFYWKQVILTDGISFKFCCFYRLRFWIIWLILIIAFVLKVSLRFYNSFFVLNVKRVKLYGIILLCHSEILSDFWQIKISKKFVNLSSLWFNNIDFLSCFFDNLIVSVIWLQFFLSLRNLILENAFKLILGRYSLKDFINGNVIGFKVNIRG